MSQWNPDVLAAAREQDAADIVRQLVAAVDVLVRDQCRCGHAKQAKGETHYFGDRTMKSPCMVKDCTCPTYRPDYLVEINARKTGLTARDAGLAWLEQEGR
ncbi:MAG: hypothetical protein NUW01_18440 [Gemmatimonadaceae bacterium]|nr:hypothetical protein [Gemmatimonadaceae bacterium]